MIATETAQVRASGSLVVRVLLHGVAAVFILAGMLALMPHPASADDDFAALVNEIVSAPREDHALVAAPAYAQDVLLAPTPVAVPNPTVNVRVHSCPDDFMGTGFYQYETACTSETALYGVPLKLTASNMGGSYLYSQPAGDGRAAPMIWYSVGTGPITITDIAQNTIRPATVFCSLRSAGNVVGSLDGTEIPVVNSAITLSLAAGDQLFCDWHRFPGGIASEPTAEAEPTTAEGAIEITKRICTAPLTAGAIDEDGDAIGTPAGFPENDLDAYLAACQSLQDGVSFSLSTGTDETSQTTFEGRVSWIGLAAGDYLISEAIPDGFGNPVVFCEGNIPGRQNIRRSLVQHDATGGMIAFSLTEGEVVTCDWFNIFAGGDATADADTDFDGLLDGDEIRTYGSDPLSDDGDGDLLPDYNEVTQHGTDPLNPDTDGDGASDHDELNAGTDPLTAEGGVEAPAGGDGGQPIDGDGDGVSDEDEFGFGTDPTLTDSDDDGLGDADELFAVGSDPLNRDSDGDLLPDGDEVFVAGTDPLAFDTDGDGVDDGSEAYFNGTDPLDSASF